MNKKDEEKASMLLDRYNQLEVRRKQFEEILAQIRFDSIRPIIEEQEKIQQQIEQIIVGGKK